MAAHRLLSVTAHDLGAAGLGPDERHAFLAALRSALEPHSSSDATEVWRKVSKHVLQPCHPFQLHRFLWQTAFKDWPTSSKGPAPAWIPAPEGVQCTNLYIFMQSFKGDAEWQHRPRGSVQADLQLLQRKSWERPDLFWPPLLEHFRIRFHAQPSRVFQEAADPDAVRWLPGAQYNIAESALAGRDPDATALLWADEARPASVRTLSLEQLRRRCYAVAAALQASRLRPGDAVAVAMPMGCDAVVAYLGIVAAGCAVVSIADSFAAPEIASRLRIASAAAVVTQDVVMRGGKAHPLFARVIAAEAPLAIVLPADPVRGLQVALRDGDVEWQEFLSRGTKLAESFKPHSADAYDTSNILFSSGTTGEPKAIVWTHVTPLRCATDAWAHLDVRARDVMAWPTNLGWMMGPFLVYAALLNGAAIALFQAVLRQGAPLGRAFGEFVAAARVTQLGLVPSIVKAWRATNCMQGLEWGALRCCGSTGEASTPDDYLWLSARAGYVPVLEVCGGTEIGGAFLSGSLLQPQAPSTFSMATFGTRLVLVDAEGRQSPHTDPLPCVGEVAIVPPLLGSSQRLLNRDHHKVYFQGMAYAAGTRVQLRRHGDEVARLAGGYFAAQGRSDDTMNLGGIKVSSVELERAVVAGVAAVAEAAAVGVPLPGGGPEQLALFLVLRAAPDGAAVPESGQQEALRAACQAAIRLRLNPLFKVDRVVLRATLPRTASNKVMRRLLRDELRAAPRL